MGHEFESVFAAIADRAMRLPNGPQPKPKPVEPIQSASYQARIQRERFVFLADWQTTRVCADTWKVCDPACWHWLTRRRKDGLLQSRRLKGSAWREMEWRVTVKGE